MRVLKTDGGTDTGTVYGHCTGTVRALYGHCENLYENTNFTVILRFSRSVVRMQSAGLRSILS